MSPVRADTFFTGIGVGAGVVGVFAVVVVLIVVLIMAKVVVRRKASYEVKKDVKMLNNPFYGNTLMMKQELEMEEIGQGPQYDVVKGHDEKIGSLSDSFISYDDVEGMPQTVAEKKRATEELSTPAGVANTRALYAQVDKSKKKEAKKEKEDESAATNTVNQYDLPMTKMLDGREGVVVSGGVEEEEKYDGVNRRLCETVQQNKGVRKESEC